MVSRGDRLARHADPSRRWHDFAVRIAGAKIEGWLDGKIYLPVPV